MSEREEIRQIFVEFEAIYRKRGGVKRFTDLELLERRRKRDREYRRTPKGIKSAKKARKRYQEKMKLEASV